MIILERRSILKYWTHKETLLKYKLHCCWT